MTDRPLYALPGGHPDKLPSSAHAGLWYDKFCFAIIPSGKKGTGENNAVTKQGWIESVTSQPVGSNALIEELRGRQRRMVEYRGGALLHIKATSRFVTGLGRQHPVENGFSWHPVLGTPYIPGSSIKGLVRAWARIYSDDEELCGRLLGIQKQAGRIEFLDAIPVAPMRLEADVMTPHYSPYYQQGEVPGDWHSPTPIPFLTAAAGACMQLGIVPTHRNARDKDSESAIATVTTWIESALRELGAGAKTAVGYGRFDVYDGTQLDTSWVEDLQARRLATLPLGERVRREIADMNAQEAMQLVRARMDMHEPTDPEYHEALRQAFCERFYAQWKNSMGQVSDKKRKQYLRWLRNEPEPATQVTPAPQRKKDKKKKRKKNK